MTVKRTTAHIQKSRAAGNAPRSPRSEAPVFDASSGRLQRSKAKEAPVTAPPAASASSRGPSRLSPIPRASPALSPSLGTGADLAVTSPSRLSPSSPAKSYGEPVPPASTPRDKLRQIVNEVISANRFKVKGPGRGGAADRTASTFAAPFGAASVYQRVRRHLDPIKHRHLLGDDFSTGVGGLKASASNASDTAGGSSRRESTVAPAAGDNDSFQARRAAAAADIKNRKPRLRLAPPPGSPNSGSGHVLSAEEAVELEAASLFQPASAEVDDEDGEPSGAGTHLPMGDEVARLPPEIQQSLMGVAMDRLNRFVLPPLKLRRRMIARNRQLAIALAQANRPTVDQLRRLRLFADWPLEALHGILSAVTFRFAWAGDLVLYEHEPCGAGIFFLTSGTCQLLKKVPGNPKSAPNKRINEKNTTVVATVHGTACFNEFQFLTEVPRVNSVRATTPCDLWCLSKEAFFILLNRLPRELREVLDARAFAKRQATLPLSYPMTVAVLRSYEMFSFCSTPLLDALVPVMKPLAVPPEYQFCRCGDPAMHMFVLRSGAVAAFRRIRGEDVHVRTLYAPCLLNGDALLNGQGAAETLRSVKGCDAYTISHDSFEHVTAAFPLEKRELVAQSRSQHVAALSLAQVRFRPLIYGIPIVRQLLKVEQINLLSTLFEGHIFSPLSLVCSASDLCEHLIIVTKGKVALGEKSRTFWTVGDAHGFTCVVPHRWVCAAVALEPVECIRIHRDVFKALLQDCGVYEKYVAIVQRMLFPPGLADTLHALRAPRTRGHGNTSDSSLRLPTLVDKDRSSKAGKVDGSKTSTAAQPSANASGATSSSTVAPVPVSGGVRSAVTVRAFAATPTPQPTAAGRGESSRASPTPPAGMSDGGGRETSARSSGRAGGGAAAGGSLQETDHSSASLNRFPLYRKQQVTDTTYLTADGNRVVLTLEESRVIPSIADYCGDHTSPPMFPVSTKGVRNSLERGFVLPGHQQRLVICGEEDDDAQDAHDADPAKIRSNNVNNNNNNNASSKSYLARSAMEDSNDSVLCRPDGLTLPSPRLIPFHSRVLTEKDKRTIAHSVFSESDPTQQRRLVKISRFLWVKQ